MKILAIDTSSVSGSIAVIDGGVILGEFNTDKVGTHSEWLLPQIERLLDELSLTIKDIGVFALSIGPGSFTGLRIGVSVLKGLSWGSGGGHGDGGGHGGGHGDIPIVGVSTLEALALGLKGDSAHGNALVVPILDARKKDIYSARFELSATGEVSRLSADVVTRPELLLEELSKYERDVLFLGAGLGVYSKMMKEGVGGAVILDDSFWNVGARHVGQIAEALIGEHGIEAASVGARELTPLYIRRSEVEFKRANPT